MNLDAVPIWLFFVGTMVLVLVCVEVGFELGRIAHRSADDEKEAPASGVSGAVLGLTAFILAFTFAIVAERYETRKQLVRADANAIRVAYLRADFLPQADRGESKQLLKTYLDRRLAFAQVGSPRTAGRGAAARRSRPDPASPVGHRRRQCRARHEFRRRRALHRSAQRTQRSARIAIGDRRAVADSHPVSGWCCTA